MKKAITLAVLLSSAGSAALAQDGKPSENSSADAQLVEIVVTAQRRSERLQDVPIAISSLSGEQLASSGTASVANLAASVAGLNISVFGGSLQPFLRGIGSDANAPNFDPSVATYVDGAYISWNKGVNVDFVGIDHVEVVKGPQGTLFGRNAVGGAINIVTRTPSQQPAAFAEVGYGNYNAIKARGYLEGGIAEGLSAGVYGSYYRRDVVTDFILTTPFAQDREDRHVTRKAARVKLAYENGPLKLTGSYDFAQSSDPDSAALRQVQPDSLGFALGGTPIIRRLTVRADNPDTSEPTTHSVILRADYELGWSDIASITAYRNTKNYGINDYDGTDAPVLAFFADQDYSKQFSQEFQLLSPKGSKVTWIAGLYYFRENTGYDPLHFYFPIVSPVPRIDDRVNVLVQSYAAFGQITYPLTDKLNITLGGRYTKDRKRFTATESFFDLSDNQVGPAAILPASSKDWQRFTPKATIDYRLDDKLLYATFSKGFKSGAYNSAGPNAPGPVDPETLTAWEVGTKSDFFNRRLTLNLAGYYYVYKNLQTQVIGANSGATLFTNAAQANIYGVDADATAALTRDLRIRAAVSYIHSEYKKFPNFASYTIQPGGNAALSLDVSGNPVQRTPKWTISGGIDYAHKFADDSGPDAALNVYHNSGFSWDPSNTLRQGAYTIVSGAVGYTLAGGRIRASLSVENLFNAKYENIRNLSTFGIVVNDSLPRMYGAALSYKY